MSRCRDQEAGAELAHALGISCEDFTSGAADILLRHLALHAQAARIEGAKAMQEAAAKACEEQRLAFFSPEYATDQPFSSFGERFACGLLIGIIEHLDPHTITGEAG